MKSVNDPRKFERLLTADEVIEALALTQKRNPRDALRWMMKTRQIAHVRVTRGAVGFRPEDVTAFIEKRRVEAK